MKKIFTLCIFAFALLLSNQDGLAQVKQAAPVADENLTVLVDEAKSMASELGLSDDQMNAFIRAYVNREKAIKNEDATNASGVSQEKVRRNDKKFIAKMKETLNDDQLMKFKEIYKRKMKQQY